MHPLHQRIILWVFIVIETGLISKCFSKVVKHILNSDPLPNTTLRGHGFLLSHVVLNNWLTLADDLSMYSSLPPITSSKSVCWYINDFEPTHFRVNYRHSGETNITCNDSAAWMMLSYRLTIWSYQVHMHQIP